MAKIRAFHGLRYTAKAGDLQNLVAPPYDVISSTERDQLASQSPHNVVALTLPEQMDDDRSKFVKYARSASRLQEWRQTGVIAPEPKPALYRYRQTFTVPGDKTVHERVALITLIKVEPYENGVVLPHEQTFPKHKEDRLRILEATRSHLECIYGLFEDDTKHIFESITSAPAEQVADVTTPDGVRHIIEVITDPGVIASIQNEIAPKRVWIADGHHRYETALAFRQSVGGGSEEIAEDFMMMALSSIADPGLLLLPTHRILKRCPVEAAELRARLATKFEIRDCANADLISEIGMIEQGGKHAFGIALPGGVGFIATVGDLEKLVSQIPGDRSVRLKELDVTILHDVIFEELLGLTGLDFFGYTRDPEEAIDAVESGAPASFLMNPPTVDDMREIAIGGEKMPQKSTYYYPKILSGLILWALEDF